jgi:hypothetical protein
MGSKISIPVSNKPTWLEYFASDFFNQLQAYLINISTNDTLQNWLSHPHHQSKESFMIVLVVGVVWFAVSVFSQRRPIKAITSLVVIDRAPFDLESPALSLPPPANTSLSILSTETLLNNRTGHVSTSGYQTSFGPSPSERNFSGLEKTAPTSYDTLLRNGMLNLDGTPTKKYSPPSGERGHRVLLRRGLSDGDGTPTKIQGTSRQFLQAKGGI